MKREKNKKFVMPQMFDVRPVREGGDLDMEKIRNVPPVLKIKQKRFFKHAEKKIGNIFYDVRTPNIADEEALKFRRLIEQEKEERKKIPAAVAVFDENKEDEFIPISIAEIRKEAEEIREEIQPKKENLAPINIFQIRKELAEEPEEIKTDYFEKFEPKERKKKRKKKKDLLVDWQAGEAGFSAGNISWKNAFPAFAVAGLVVLVAISSLNVLGRGLKIKDSSINSGNKAYASLMSAANNLGNRDYAQAQFEFNEAFNQFSSISSDINDLGNIVVESSKFIPFASKLSSGAHLAAAGKNISEIGMKSAEIIATLEKIKNPLKEGGEAVSFLKIFQDTDEDLRTIASLAKELEENLENVNADDIPAEQRDKFIELKKKLPEANAAIAGFTDDSYVFTDILGGNGPRKYLFLFQNNQEMRATGGFIGTYGVLDIFNGRVNKFFIDGIFNPDGQLREKVIPPAPVQKISAAWSLHDSNWFPDFPVSAEKASWFYEKTGGPTVDGVITMTPTVLQKLLEITGPIEMPEYDTVVDKDNFIEKIQYEVEVDYDKEENMPKKILADLAPKILDRIFNTKDVAQAAKIMDIMADSLSEKQILIYSKNYKIQKILSERGWSGEMLDTGKDYLSVINTNINGYKTDGVVEEKISHSAEIGNDGSIIDTVTITRHHNGGDSEFDWWNKVNSDYMRVYVPKGSRLLEASGQTREFTPPPLDYKALGFKSDPQVQMEENSMVVDEESGTRMYEDAGKTVFANWAYVSPKETVEIKYKYLLPFKIDTNPKAGQVEAYSVLFQKQSGSIGSKINSSVSYPDSYRATWKYPEEKASSLPSGQNGFNMEDVLATDKFVGVALTKN